MPVFEYIAINPAGKNVKGSVDADNMRVVRQKLRAQGIFPTDIKEGKEFTKNKTKDLKRFFVSDRISLKDLSITTRQLATLVGAGLPLVNALQALTDQTDSATLKRIIVEVRENVEEGLSLAKALAKFPKAFPRLYVNLVSSGEASGTLDTVLDNLADYLEGQVELRRKVRSALTYPILMLFVCTAVIGILVVFVVPNIVSMFKKQGAKLPLPTVIMIGISDFIINYWYLILLFIIAAVWLIAFYYRQPAGRAKIDKIFLHLPIFSPLYIKVTTARVAKTLGTLLSSGVDVLVALDISRNIVANVHLAKALEDAKDGVREGRSLASELNKSGYFPTMLSHMIAVGEKSGQLDSMLNKAGKAYESEVNAALSGITTLLEPLMILVVGTIVFGIIISVLLPMADLISVIQR